VVAQLEARSVPFSETYLAPTPLREVLARCCRNLAHHFATTGNVSRGRLFAGFAAEFESVCEENSHS
jgi:hypothetical protein